VVGLLIRAPSAQVESIFAQDGACVERNVYDQSLSRCGLLVCQLQQQKWTFIVDPYMLGLFEDTLDGYCALNIESLPASLSQRLHTRTILYEASSSGSTIGYQCWDNGVLVEQLVFDECERPDNLTIEEMEGLGILYQPQIFTSQLQNIAASEIEDAYSFVFDFLQRQQVSWLTLYGLARMSGITQKDFLSFSFVKWPES
jgi:hypothetical protein